MNEETKQNELCFVTGLWERKDKNGNSLFSGSFAGVQVMIFANKYKEKDNDPHYKMYFTKKHKPEEQPTNNGDSYGNQSSDDTPW